MIRNSSIVLSRAVKTDLQEWPARGLGWDLGTAARFSRGAGAPQRDCSPFRVPPPVLAGSSGKEGLASRPVTVKTEGGDG